MTTTRPPSREKPAQTSAVTVGYEAQLWQMADALRGSMDATEYQHVVLGLIFLKYISNAVEEQHAKLVADEKICAHPEDPDEGRAQSIVWVPPEARWQHLKAQAGRSAERLRPSRARQDAPQTASRDDLTTPFVNRAKERSCLV